MTLIKLIKPNFRLNLKTNTRENLMNLINTFRCSLITSWAVIGSSFNLRANKNEYTQLLHKDNSWFMCVDFHKLISVFGIFK